MSAVAGRFHLLIIIMEELAAMEIQPVRLVWLGLVHVIGPGAALVAAGPVRYIMVSLNSQRQKVAAAAIAAISMIVVVDWIMVVMAGPAAAQTTIHPAL
jgi:hypothetical protein